MNVRTNLHAGQDGSIDMEKLSALVNDLDCQIAPLEMLSLAQKYCKNLDPQKVAAILEIVGGKTGPGQFLAMLGR